MNIIIEVLPGEGTVIFLDFLMKRNEDDDSNDDNDDDYKVDDYDEYDGGDDMNGRKFS